MLGTTSCQTTKYHNTAIYPPLDSPSDCTIEWVYDEARSTEVPKCVSDDLVQHKKAAEFIEDITKAQEKDIIEYEFDWKKALLGTGVGLIVLGIGKYFSTAVSLVLKWIT